MRIKGYNTNYGYMGYDPDNPRADEDGYVLFDSEKDYRDFMQDKEKN